MADDSIHRQGSDSNLPVPDPTVLTTEALVREVAGVRAILESRIAAHERLTTALRAGDEKFENERDRRIAEVKLESDRRLTEVATEREKALKIKEEADKEALRLDREIRQFKDEKASARTDAAVAALEQRLRPLDSFVAGEQGQKTGSEQANSRHDVSAANLWAAAGVLVAALTIITYIIIATHK